MKLAILALACLFVPQFAASECVTVMTVSAEPTFQASSQSISVATLSGGRPIEGVQVDLLVYGLTKQVQYSAISNGAGIATIEHVAPAKYEILIKSPWVRPAELWIAVSKSHRKSRFAVDLYPDETHAAIDKALSNAANQPPTQFSRFSGTVFDPSGAWIRNTQVMVWSAENPYKEPQAEGSADDRGWFSISLPEGRYVALFSEPGFSLKALVFEVSQSAPQNGVDETLEIGHGCAMDAYRD